VLPRPYRGGLAGQDEEGGLEGVLGVVVAEQAAADAPDHRPVPFDKCGEGGRVPLLQETPQELPVGQAGAVLEERGPAQALTDLARLVHAHVMPSAGVNARPLLLLAACRGIDTPFSTTV
jgi:hypothetical protein